MSSQTIKTAILSPALRAVGQQTQFKKASDIDFSDAFQFYTEMLEFWRNDRGVILYSEIPTNMNAGIGTADPVQALKENLILYIADHFFYEPTQAQRSNASRSFRVLKARSNGPATMNCPNKMPRGSGNTWYNSCYYDDCENGSQPIVTESGVQVVSE